MATARTDLAPTATVPLAAVVIVPATVMIMVVPATVVIVIVAATVIIMIVAAAVVMVIAVVVVARIGLQVAVSWQEFRLIMEKDHELAVRRFREIHVLLGWRPLVVHQRCRRRRHVRGRHTSGRTSRCRPSSCWWVVSVPVSPCEARPVTGSRHVVPLGSTISAPNKP
jgi:hypothetical protein